MLAEPSRSRKVITFCFRSSSNIKPLKKDRPQSPTIESDGGNKCAITAPKNEDAHRKTLRAGVDLKLV
jgi:hypothetical protein